MKKFNVKKALSVSLAALAICPTIASVKPNVNTYAAAAFIADTDGNGAYNIDESQIKIGSKRYVPAGTGVDVKTSGGVISTTGSANKCNILARRVFSVKVAGDKNLTTDNVNALKNMKLTVTYKVQGKTNTATYQNPTVTKIDSKTYNVSFDVVTRGDTYSFKTSAVSGISGFKCTYAADAPASGSGDYYMVTANVANGESVFISVKNTGGIKYEYLLNWANRICMYANSLSKTTGVKLGTLYICLDYPTDYYAYSFNIEANKACDLLGFVAFSPAATTEEMNRLAKGNNEITWCMMHEIAHSYGIYVTPQTFNNNYSPGDDDFYCNARGITAIQNCDNLRNTKIYHSDSANATYDQILDKINMSGFGFSDKVYYTYAKKLVDIGKKYGWDKLENFFAATSDYSYNSTENKEAAKAVNELTGKSYSNSTNYLRLVNAFRKLYKTSWYQNFNYYAFKDFVKNEIGTDLVKDIATLKNYK